MPHPSLDEIREDGAGVLPPFGIRRKAYRFVARSEPLPPGSLTRTLFNEFNSAPLYAFECGVESASVG